VVSSLSPKEVCLHFVVFFDSLDWFFLL